MAGLIVVANLAVTGYLAGLIWTVQVVHYPLFEEVGPEQFPRYHALHCRMITAIVAAPMALEVLLSLLLVVARPAPFPAPLAWACAALTALTWIATAAFSVPLHDRLGARGHDAAAIGRLVATNWLRTLAWTYLLDSVPVRRQGLAQGRLAGEPERCAGG